MGRLLASVAAVVVVLLVALWALQRHLVYFPGTSQVPSAGSVVSGAQDVTLQTDDGVRLGAWLVPAREPARSVAVLVANGNAGDRSARAPLAAALSERGLTVLLFDYRGYGGNAGRPSEGGLVRDARAAQRFLVDEAGFRPDRVLYFGESLGAAVVTALAVDRPPAGLLLRSPFVDLASVGRLHYPVLPVRALLRDRFPVAEQLREVDAPVSVVYGSADTVVPASQSRAVAEAAPRLERLVEVPGADHNDVSLLVGDELLDAVVELAELAG